MNNPNEVTSYSFLFFTVDHSTHFTDYLLHTCNGDIRLNRMQAPAFWERTVRMLAGIWQLTIYCFKLKFQSSNETISFLLCDEHNKKGISNVNNFSYPKNSGSVNSMMASNTKSHIVYSFIHEKRQNLPENIHVPSCQAFLFIIIF